MGTERRMNFYESFYGLTSLLPERERQKVNTALLDYFFESKEPEGLSDQGSKVFEGCRGRINASVRGRENIEKRYSSDSTYPSKTPSTYGSKHPSTYGSKVDSTYPSKTPSTYGTDRERDIDIERDKENKGAKRKNSYLLLLKKSRNISHLRDLIALILGVSLTTTSSKAGSYQTATK